MVQKMAAISRSLAAGLSIRAKIRVEAYRPRSRMIPISAMIRRAVQGYVFFLPVSGVSSDGLFPVSLSIFFVLLTNCSHFQPIIKGPSKSGCVRLRFSDSPQSQTFGAVILSVLYMVKDRKTSKGLVY